MACSFDLYKKSKKCRRFEMFFARNAQESLFACGVLPIFADENF